MVTRDERPPIVMFTNDDTRHVKKAVTAGLSACIVAGLSPDRIRHILDVALARFEYEQALLQTLASACFSVTDLAITAHLAHSNAASAQRLAALQANLKCGTNCGSCLPQLQRMLASLA